MQRRSRTRSILVSFVITVTIGFAGFWWFRPQPACEIQLPDIVEISGAYEIDNRWVALTLEVYDPRELSDFDFDPFLRQGLLTADEINVACETFPFSFDVLCFIDLENPNGVSAPVCCDLEYSGRTPDGKFVVISFPFSGTLRLNYFDTETGTTSQVTRPLPHRELDQEVWHNAANLRSRDFSTIAIAHSTEEVPLQIEVVDLRDGSLRTVISLDDRTGKVIARDVYDKIPFAEWAISDDGKYIALSAAWEGLELATGPAIIVLDTSTGHRVAELKTLPTIPPPTLTTVDGDGDTADFSISEKTGAHRLRFTSTGQIAFMVSHRKRYHWASSFPNFEGITEFQFDPATDSVVICEEPEVVTLSQTSGYQLQYGLAADGFGNDMRRILDSNGDVVFGWSPVPDVLGDGVYGDLVEGTTGLVVKKTIEPRPIPDWLNRVVVWLGFDSLIARKHEAVWFDWKTQTATPFRRTNDLSDVFACNTQIGLLRHSASGKNTLEVWDAPPRVWSWPIFLAVCLVVWVTFYRYLRGVRAFSPSDHN